MNPLEGLLNAMSLQNRAILMANTLRANSISFSAFSATFFQASGAILGSPIVGSLNSNMFFTMAIGQVGGNFYTS